MNSGIQSAAYIAASVLFILSLGGLSGHESAKRAVWYGMAGMALAVGATVFAPQVGLSVLLMAMLALGAVLGAVLAQRVHMTGMPQLVAALHSFVGLAAVLIGINSQLSTHVFATAAEEIIHEVEIFLGVFIGAVTFAGSIIAFGKLSGRIGGGALVLPGRHAYNITMLGVSLLLMILYIQHSGSWTLYAMTLIAVVLGAHLVMAIGGADMPVVVSMLNSYSGWAAAATRLPARQRSSDRDRRAGRLIRCHPLLHHVPGDEPFLPVGHPGRIRHHIRLDRGADGRADRHRHGGRGGGAG